MLTNDSEVASHMCTCKNMCCHMCMREEGKNRSQSADKLHGDTGGQKHIFTQSNYSLVRSRRGKEGGGGETECHRKKMNWTAALICCSLRSKQQQRSGGKLKVGQMHL